MKMGKPDQVKLFRILAAGKIGVGDGETAVAEEMDIVGRNHLKGGIAVLRVAGLPDPQER
jgi:hypothetical protein